MTVRGQEVRLEDGPLLISNEAPTSRQRLVAKLFLGILIALYLVTLPFSNVRLARIDMFVPALDVVLFILDMITAVLLYSYASVLGSRSLRILANGYLFTALIIFAHGLTFPGAFSAEGLLGATIQTSAYLQTIWRAGLPCAVIAYTLTKHNDGGVELGGGRKSYTLLNILAVVTIVAVIVWLTTAGSDLFPQMMVDAQQKRWSFDLPFMIPLEISAIALLWWRRQSILDLWLLLVLCTWLLSTLLVGATAYRYSLPWYQSRFYGLLACSLVLLALLSQIGALYARLAVSMVRQRREREGRLMQVDAMLAVVAHEINQPLSAIVMNSGTGLKVIKRSEREIGLLGDILEDIARDGRRVSEIVNGIRGFFKRDDQLWGSLVFSELVDDTLTIMSGELQAHHVLVEADLGIPATIRGHRTQLQQVILNLVTNAMESMDAIAARDRRLRLVTERQGMELQLRIEDSGPGVAPALRDTLFDPFVTTKAKGTGLGLSICRTIVEAHGGRIWATGSSHGGAAIVISLPVSTNISSPI